MQGPAGFPQPGLPSNKEPPPAAWLLSAKHPVRSASPGNPPVLAWRLRSWPSSREKAELLRSRPHADPCPRRRWSPVSVLGRRWPHSWSAKPRRARRRTRWRVADPVPPLRRTPPPAAVGWAATAIRPARRLFRVSVCGGGCVVGRTAAALPQASLLAPGESTLVLRREGAGRLPLSLRSSRLAAPAWAAAAALLLAHPRLPPVRWRTDCLALN